MCFVAQKVVWITIEVKLSVVGCVNFTKHAVTVITGPQYGDLVINPSQAVITDASRRRHRRHHNFFSGWNSSVSALDHYARRVAVMKRISSPGVPWRSSRIFPACTTSISTSTSTINLRQASFIERGHIKLKENEGLLFINSKGYLLYINTVQC